MASHLKGIIPVDCRLRIPCEQNSFPNMSLPYPASLRVPGVCLIIYGNYSPNTLISVFFLLITIAGDMKTIQKIVNNLINVNIFPRSAH